MHYAGAMFFWKKHRSHERFYLLPGQGGKNYHRKQQVFRLWAAAVGLLMGGIIAAVMWYFSRPKL